MKKFLSANEAVAHAAAQAGCVVASAYPGTPSTEILENIAKFKDTIKCEWAVNEKVAVETAIGASMAGARALTAMKADCGTLTCPNSFIRALPRFCFSKTFILRVTSPP